MIMIIELQGPSKTSIKKQNNLLMSVKTKERRGGDEGERKGERDRKLDLFGLVIPQRANFLSIDRSDG